MPYQIDPETDPIAACLLIFAKRGAAIRAERERTLAAAQSDRESMAGNGVSILLPAQPNTTEWRSAQE